MRKCKLRDFRIDKRPFNNSYFIEAVYIEETDEDISQHILQVPITLFDYPNVERTLYSNMMTVNLGFGELDNATIKTEVVEVKTKEMTIEEIEKALGHKVKIVGGYNEKLDN